LAATLLRSTGCGAGDATIPAGIEARANKVASIVLPMFVMQWDDDDEIRFE